MSQALDKMALLQKLANIEPEEAIGRELDAVQAMSLARSLRSLAELDAEHAYKMCHDVAERALGTDPDPTRSLQE